MSPPAALALKMTEGFMSSMLPHEITNQLAPYFRYANSVLDNTEKECLKRWPDKVRCIGRTQPLMPPSISADIFAVVSDSLLEGKRFQVSYLKRNAEKPVDWTINPLGLVIHDSLITLVCTMGNYQQLKDVRTLQLHRIQSAQRCDDMAIVPEGFSLNTFISEGHFGYLKNKEAIRLKALFEQDATVHLEETPLSSDQQLTPKADNMVLVEATIADTAQLRWWLLGFGGRVEVLKPLKLRNELKTHAEQMATKYT
jgi:predicted DNA-binding transcriptional regulator YafY